MSSWRIIGAIRPIHKEARSPAPAADWLDAPQARDAVVGLR